MSTQVSAKIRVRAKRYLRSLGLEIDDNNISNKMLISLRRFAKTHNSHLQNLQSFYRR